ncbi:MAG: trypsin-like peptidase domain-containing protein [Ruminococcus sp.]|nr:trypsin-like peptidase domain-containing protein [Ruminococcus sp.]
MTDDFKDIMNALEHDDEKDTIDLLEDQKQAQPEPSSHRTTYQDNPDVSFFDMKSEQTEEIPDAYNFDAFSDTPQIKTEEPIRKIDESMEDMTPADRVFAMHDVSEYPSQERMQADEYRNVYRRTPYINGQPIQSKMTASDRPAATPKTPNAQYRDGYRAPQRQASHRQPKAKIGAGTIAILLIVCVLVSGLAGFGGSLLAGYMRSGTPTEAGVATQNKDETGVTPVVATAEPGTELTTSQIVDKVAGSVVEITTESVQTTFYGQYPITGAGSGVIIRENGYILTNYHVIEGASTIKVTTTSGEEYDAKVIGYDNVDVDIALLKIEASGLTCAELGDSSTVNIGDKAVVIGNPLGTLGGSVTEGIISALDREITIDEHSMHLMQTDAAINPGNSGGGTFNSYGKLIGIVVAKSSSSSSGTTIDNIGFVIPINSIVDILDDLEQSGYVTGRPDSGMEFVDSTNYYYSGVYISSVKSGSNAASAGFRQGDKVVSVDGKQISSASDVENIINQHAVGDTVTFELERSYEKITLSLTLEEKTQDTASSEPDDSFFQNPFGLW